MAYIVSPALESYATGDPDDITARWFTTSPFTTRPDGRGLTPLLSGGALLPPVEESTADIASSYGAGTVAVDPAYYGDSMWNVAPWLSGDLPALTGISIPGQDMSSWPAMNLGLQQFDPDAVPDGAAGFAAAQPFKAPLNNNFNPPAWGPRGPAAPAAAPAVPPPIAAAGGLQWLAGGLAILSDNDYGIFVSTNGAFLAVNTCAGLTWTARAGGGRALEVLLKTDGGLLCDAEYGLYVDLGDGLIMSGNEITVNIIPSSHLYFQSGNLKHQVPGAIAQTHNIYDLDGNLLYRLYQDALGHLTSG